MYQQNNIDEETQFTNINDPYSSLKHADLRHQINQIKEGNAI